MTEERKNLLKSLDFTGKKKDELKSMVKEHSLTIDEIAALRYIGKMTLGQYASILAHDKPWMDIIELK